MQKKKKTKSQELQLSLLSVCYDKSTLLHKLNHHPFWPTFGQRCQLRSSRANFKGLTKHAFVKIFMINERATWGAATFFFFRSLFHSPNKSSKSQAHQKSVRWPRICVLSWFFFSPFFLAKKKKRWTFLCVVCPAWHSATSPPPSVFLTSVAFHWHWRQPAAVDGTCSSNMFEENFITHSLTLYMHCRSHFVE